MGVAQYLFHSVARINSSKNRDQDKRDQIDYSCTTSFIKIYCHYITSSSYAHDSAGRVVLTRKHKTNTKRNANLSTLVNKESTDFITLGFFPSFMPFQSNHIYHFHGVHDFKCCHVLDGYTNRISRSAPKHLFWKVFFFFP